MPNQYDENANQDQFFCGQSWSDAKHVCEPCPGGSRLECSNVGHDCFAGVTGCRTPSALSNNNSVDNNSNSNNNNDHLQSSQQPVLDTNINIQSQQQPSPAIVFVNPTPPTTSTSFTSSSNNNNIANNKCTSHSNCQNGQLCNKQGYCGQCSNEGRGCSVDQVCRTTASCHVTQTPGPGKCYNKEELHRFCRTAWKEDSYQCNLDTMVCERSDDNNFGSGLGSAVQVQEQEEGVVVAPPTQEMMTTISTTITTPMITSRPTLYTNPLGNNYFCGESFSTVASNCLASKPCPNGFASGHCGAMEGCFRVNQCVALYNEAALSSTSTASSVSSSSGVSLALNEENTSTTSVNQQQQQQQQQPAGPTNSLSQEVFTNTIPNQEQSRPAVVGMTPSEPPPTNSWSTTSYKQCTSHNACTTGQFCNEGYCGQCSNALGIGCSVDEVCRTTASCHVTQTPGPGKCYQKEELHRFCQTAWKDESYQCNLDLMVCEETTTNANVIQVAVETQTTTTTTTTTPALVSVVPATTAASLPSSKPTNTPSKALITSGPINANVPAKCSICGDLQVDNDATIFYDGRELSCTELEDKVFLLVGIAMGSENCLASQELYSATCCIDPPVNPCNLCRSGDNDFPLKSEVNVVSAAGETESCLEVFQSLLSRREQSSWQCRSSQKELQAKCCDGTTFDYGNAPVPSPGVDWSPSLGVDEPASYPSEGFYYTKPDWNWKENWKNCSSRITSTTTAFALVSMVWLLWQ